MRRNDIDVNLKCGPSEEEFPPLVIAILMNPDVRPLQMLLQRYDIDDNLKDRMGNPLLNLALRLNHPESIRSLLERHDIDINLQDCDGLTPLAFLVKHMGGNNKQLMVEMLVARNADIHIKDKRGWTPMAYAAACYQMDIPTLRFLLECGADPNTKNNQGTTPLSRTFYFFIIWYHRISGTSVQPMEPMALELMMLLLEQEQTIVDTTTLMRITEEPMSTEDMNLIRLGWDDSKHRLSDECTISDDFTPWHAAIVRPQRPARAAHPASLADAAKDLEAVNVFLERDEIDNQSSKIPRSRIFSATEAVHALLKEILKEDVVLREKDQRNREGEIRLACWQIFKTMHLVMFTPAAKARISEDVDRPEGECDLCNCCYRSTAYKRSSTRESPSTRNWG